MQTKLRCKSCGIVGLAVLAGALSLPAQAAPFALGLRIGTLGLFGAEATLGLSDYVNVRLPFSMLNLDHNEEDDGVDYQGKIKLKSFGGQVDVHPFKGTFYLTAGVFANDNQLRLHASDPTGTKEYELGDNDTKFRSDPNDPLTLKGAIKFGSTAPFLGLGWGNAIQGKSQFYFRFEMGVLFQGSSSVDLNATGSAIPQGSNQSFSTTGNSQQAQAFQSLVDEEREKIEGNVSNAIKFYPSINLGLGFRFGS